MSIFPTFNFLDSPVAGNAVFGGVVKGAGNFFSNIKDMSSKMVQSVAG